MIVQNDVSVIKKLIDEQRGAPMIEHCAFGFAVIDHNNEDNIVVVDSTIMDKYTHSLVDYLVIPKSVCVAFLSGCIKNNKIPIIYHTHGEVFKNGEYQKVDFSERDMQFITSFVKYARNIKGIHECIFAVTDGLTVKYHIVNDSVTEDYLIFLTELNRYAKY